jgi:adenine-specific DNA-methyltransferase
MWLFYAIIALYKLHEMIQTHQIPHLVKYMGAKRNILDFVVETIEEVDPSGSKRLYDVFSGSGVVGGAFRNLRPVTSNDIQEYSNVLSKIYLQNYLWEDFPNEVVENFVTDVEEYKSIIEEDLCEIPRVDYQKAVNFEETVRVEEIHKALINNEFGEYDHLFIQRFSGTYWSLQQCIEIDAISSVIRNEKYKDSSFYFLVKGALMFSMAYCSQSTGHYAQYRILTEENIDDIYIYRRKSILTLFINKLASLREFYNGDNNSPFKHEMTNLDFIDSIKKSKKKSIIYADPPYQFVHYSRFYHALETLVRYDYPEVKYKGRYRIDRHQSPFCIKTKVKDAFAVMFKEVIRKKSILVLSYSDNGMISKEDLLELAENLSDNYYTEIKELDYIHSTMGRQRDKNRSVKEILIIYTPK